MFFSILKKEFILALRDVHALLVLFVMPAAFILVMSLALPDADEEAGAHKSSLGFHFEDQDDIERPLAEQLLGMQEFNVRVYDSGALMRAGARTDNLVAMVVVPRDFIRRLDGRERIDRLIQIEYAPTTPPYMRTLASASLRQVLGNYQLQERLAQEVENPVMRQGLRDRLLGKSLIEELESQPGEGGGGRPSAVQQSVPAWLIFSMFFVVIPISTTFLVEKQTGAMQRLRTLPVPDVYFLWGKLLPYLSINLIQTTLMFLTGMFIVPLAGGQALYLGSNAWLLVPMSLAISLAAISFALLIATRVNTTEQATTIGGISNLLLAAVGGIMVPAYIMPEPMQNLARYSPMNWGLEGFLTILLRQGAFIDILPAIIQLLALAAVMFALALLGYRRAFG